MNRYYKNKIGLDIGKFWREIGRILSVIISFALLTGIYKYFVGSVDGWLMLFAYAVSYIIFYCLCVYTSCMNAYEKGLFWGVAKKIRENI